MKVQGHDVFVGIKLSYTTPIDPRTGQTVDVEIPVDRENFFGSSNKEKAYSVIKTQQYQYLKRFIKQVQEDNLGEAKIHFEVRGLPENAANLVTHKLKSDIDLATLEFAYIEVSLQVNGHVLNATFNLTSSEWMIHYILDDWVKRQLGARNEITQSHYTITAKEPLLNAKREEIANIVNAILERYTPKEEEFEDFYSEDEVFLHLSELIAGLRHTLPPGKYERSTNAMLNTIVASEENKTVFHSTSPLDSTAIRVINVIRDGLRNYASIYSEDRIHALINALNKYIPLTTGRVAKYLGNGVIELTVEPVKFDSIFKLEEPMSVIHIAVTLKPN